MSLKFKIREFYYQSKFYTFFSILQVIFCLSLLIYLSVDYKTNFRKYGVQMSEAIIAFLMALDVILYTYINGLVLGPMMIIEWMTIFLFVSSYFFLVFRGINKTEENIELFLMIVRLFLQISRFILAISRIKENQQMRNAANTEIHLEKDKETNLKNDTVSVKSIEMVVI